MPFLEGMNTFFYLPGDDAIDMTLAEFIGFFWCRYLDGQVVGQKIVRFLASKEQFEAARKTYGPSGVVMADGDETIEQLAFKALPAFHASLDEMAKVEHKLEERKWHGIYRAHLRDFLRPNQHLTGPLTDDEVWTMITAPPSIRARAAYLVVDAQKPKQQMLLE